MRETRFHFDLSHNEYSLRQRIKAPAAERSGDRVPPSVWHFPMSTMASMPLQLPGLVKPGLERMQVLVAVFVN